MMQPRNGRLQPMDSLYQHQFSPMNNNYSNTNNNYLAAIPPFGSTAEVTPRLLSQENQSDHHHSVLNTGPTMPAEECEMFPTAGEQQQFQIDDMNEECLPNPSGDAGSGGPDVCNSVRLVENQSVLGGAGDFVAETANQNLTVNESSSISMDLMSKCCEHQGPSPISTLSDKTSNVFWTEVPKQPVFFQKATPTVGGPAFTFTTPTQSSLYSPALVAPTGTSFLRATPHTFTPTACTPWQHSVPQRLAWSQDGLARMQGVSIFTGSMSSSCNVDCSQTSQLPLCSSSAISPIPSCSQPPRRPKRHSSENLDYLSPTNKIRLTDEKIAQHMQELRIHCQSVSDHPAQSSDINSQGQSWEMSSPECRWTDPAKRQTCRKRNQKGNLSTDDQWQSFKELEDKLSVSDEESDNEKEVKVSEEPKLHILGDIERIIPSQTTIPQDILDEIQKPRMEVVLWTPPEGSIRKLVDDSLDNKPNKSVETVDTELSTIVEDDSGLEEMDLTEEMLEL